MQNLYQYDGTQESGENLGVNEPIDSTGPDQSSKKFKIVPFIIGLITLILVFVTGTVLGAAYMPNLFSFVPSSVRQTVNGVLLQMPVPKNAEQIFIGFLQNSKDIKSYDQKIFVEAQVEGLESEIPGISTSVSFAASSEGPIDVSNSQNPKYSQRIVLVLGDGFSYENLFDSEIAMVDNSLYFKLNEITDLVTSTFPIDQSIFRQWFSLDLTEFGDYVGAYSDASEEFDSLNINSEQLTADMRDILINIGIVPHFKLQGKEDLDGVKAFKVSAKISGDEISELMIKFLKEAQNLYSEYGISSVEMTEEDFSLIKDSYSDFISLFEIDMWITESNYFPIRVASSVAFKVPNDVINEGELSLSPSSSTASFAMNIGWDAENINSIEPIVAPENAEPFENLFTALLYGAMSEDVEYDASEYSTVLSEVSTVADAIDLYMFENGSIPSSLNDLVIGGYLDAINLDESGYPYVEFFSDSTVAVAIGVVGVNSSSPLFVVYDSLNKEVQELSLFEYLTYIESVVQIEGARDIVDNNAEPKLDATSFFDLAYPLFLHRYLP